MQQQQRIFFCATFGILALASACTACTTFDGVELPASIGTEAGKTDGLREDGTEASAPLMPAPDAGAGGEIDATTAPMLGYLSIADAAKACALVAKCLPLAPSINESIAVPLDSVNFASCVDWAAGPVPSTHVGVALQGVALACVAKAGSCVAAGACLSVEDLAADDSRCSGKGSQESCDPSTNSIIRCDFHDILHCDGGYFAPGSTCMVGSDGKAWCATDKNCVGTSCIGPLLDYCGSSGLHQSVNCASVGYTCGVDRTVDGGDTDCLTGDRVKTCTAAGTDCNGNIVAVCDGQNSSEFDCAALGGTCSKAGGTARCVRAADACTTSDADMNACSGSTISLCIGGQRASFDCASAGMQCVPGTAQQSGRCG